MLRFSFLPLIAVWLGLLSGLLTIILHPAHENPSSAPIAQRKTCPQVKPSTIRATRKDKLERAVEENIRKWTIQIKHSSGEKRVLAYYFRAENYYLLGKYDDATKDLDSVLNLAKEVRTYFNARINNGLGQYEAALNELGWNKYGDATRAYALLKTGQAQRCIEECSKCINQHDAIEVAYLIRGQAYHSLGKDQLAIKDFTKSLYKATGWDESFANYQSSQIYDLDTELRLLHNAEVYQRRATCFARTRQPTRAMQDVKQSEQLGFSPGRDACLSRSVMSNIDP